MIKDHLVHIQKLYTISVETDSEANTAFSDGILLKRVFTNEYCFIKQSSDVFISFFNSDWKSLEKIETDYLDCAATFLASSAEFTQSLIEAKV
jgi:hypothetical protein